MSETVLLVGCGNMGFAMLEGWLAGAAPPRVYAVEPTPELRARAAEAGARAVAEASELPGDLRPALTFLAVKPQVMGDVLPAYAALAGGATTFVSVAAGLPIRFFEQALPGPTPVLRCMPNTPAAVGAGMMVCVANAHVDAAARALGEQLLAASGAVAWIDDEAQMDAVTALSGSGPAYVFHLIEAMAEAGRAAGLPADLAARLARQTVYGAGLLAYRSEVDAAELRRQVTSPNGTTAAALDVLMRDGRFIALLTEAIAAAKARSIELGAG